MKSMSMKFAMMMLLVLSLLWASACSEAVSGDGDENDGDAKDGDVADGDESDGDNSDGDFVDGDRSDGDVTDGDLEQVDCSACDNFPGIYCIEDVNGPSCPILGVENMTISAASGLDCGFIVRVNFLGERESETFKIIGCDFRKIAAMGCSVDSNPVSGSFVISCPELCTVTMSQAACEATDGDMTDGDITDGDMTDGDLTDGDLADGDLTDGDLTDGDLTDGDMTDGDMTDDDLTDGDLTDGDLTDGDLTDGDLTDGDMTDGDLTDGDLTDGDLTDGDLTDGDLTDGDLTDGDLTDGDLTDGDLTDGDLTDGDLTDGDLTDGDLTDGDLTDGDLTDGDLTDGDLTDGDLTDGDLTDGDLTDGDLTDGDIFDIEIDPVMDWLQLEPELSPSMRFGFAFAYDPDRDVAVLYGGQGGSGTYEWGGDNWALRSTAASPTGYRFGAMAYHEGIDKMVHFGGNSCCPNLSHDDTWLYTDGVWSEAVIETVPPARHYQVMAYDSDRNVVVMHGGRREDGDGSPWTDLSDTWEFDGFDWSPAAIAAPGPELLTHAMVYDSVNQRMVLLDGSTTWILENDAWSILATDTSPGDRNMSSMVFDSLRGVVVLFGGSDNTGRYGTWEFDGSDWYRVFTAHSPQENIQLAGMIFDSQSGHSLHFGGSGCPGPAGYCNQTWIYGPYAGGVDGDVIDGDLTDGDLTDGDLTDGDLIDGDLSDGDLTDGDLIDGDLSDGDLTDGDLIDGDLYDGDLTDGDLTDGDLTDGDLIDEDLTDGDLTDGDLTDGDLTDGDITDGDMELPTCDGGCFYSEDPFCVGDNLCQCGGEKGIYDGFWYLMNCENYCVHGSLGCDFVDLEGQDACLCIELDGDMTDGDLIDGDLIDGDLIDGDLIDGDLIDGDLIDGDLTDGDLIDGDWIDDDWTDSDDFEIETDPLMDWVQLSPDLSPSARFDFGFAYDPDRDVAVVFGGQGGSGTYEWTGDNWVLRSTAASPTGNRFGAMAYHEDIDKVVYFGGNTCCPNLSYDDTWLYTDGVWSPLVTDTIPPARQYHVMAYDSDRKVVVMHGGRRDYGDGSPWTDLSDTWEFDGLDWSPAATAAPGPQVLTHTMVYDSVNQRMVLLDGSTTWILEDDAWSVLNTDTNPGTRNRSSMAFDSSRGVVVLFGGSDSTGVYGTWEFDGTDWYQVFPAHSPQEDIYGARMIFDSQSGHSLFFGGTNCVSKAYCNQTWIYGPYAGGVDGDVADGDMVDGDLIDGDLIDGDLIDGDVDGDWMEDDGEGDLAACTEIYNTYANVVLEFGSESTLPVDGATVTPLWNHNGEVIDGITPVTVGPDGAFSFVDLPMCDDRKVAFKVEGPDAGWVTSYMYELNIDIPDFPLWAVGMATYIGAPILAGITVQPGKAMLAGATYWMEPVGDGLYDTVPIGCSTIEADPFGGDVRYFGDNGLPTTIPNQAYVNPLNGRYLIANLDPGETSVINKVDGIEVNRTRFVGVGDAETIFISSMLLFSPINPMNCDN